MEDTPNQNHTEAPDHHEPIGERLSRQRNSLGLSLEDVAKELRLDKKIVQALEADDFKHLPSPAYIKGYLRSYAQLLGLDSQSLIEQYQNVTRPVEPEFRPPSPPPTDYQTLRSRTYVVGSVIALLLVLLAAWWYTQDKPAVTQSAALKENPSVAPQKPLDTTSKPGPVTLPKPLVTKPEASSGPSQILPTMGTHAENMPVKPSPEVSLKASNSNIQAKPGAIANHPGIVQSQLILSLTHRSWVQIKDANGKRLAYGMMAAGAHQSFEGIPPFSVFLGYASGAELSLNGRPIKITPFIRANHTARLKVQAQAADSGQ